MIRTDRWKLVHYPKLDRYQLFDLINDPQGTLKFLFGFLGSNDNRLENSSRVKFYRERAGVWASSFSVQDRRIFAREAGDLLLELGYEKDYSWVNHGCRAHGPWIEWERESTQPARRKDSKFRSPIYGNLENCLKGRLPLNGVFNHKWIEKID